MGRLLRSISWAALACVPLAVGLSSPARAGDCKPAAIEKLRTWSPDGYAIYREIKDKKFFLGWIACDDAQFGLSTAVHESVHFTTAETDAFPLIGGGKLERPHEVTSFFAPTRIAARFKENDFVQTYLKPGSSSAAQDFLYLLDELNAYSHDLNAAIRLKDLRRADQDVDYRDGLAAMMAFVATYVQTAEEREPETWTGLRKPAVAKAFSTLWTQAEGVMAASCGIPNFGTEDRTFIRQTCGAKPQSSLHKLLGRAPICPVDCLKTAPDVAQAGEPDTTGSLRREPASLPPARPGPSGQTKR